MPLVRVETNECLAIETKQRLSSALSHTCAEVIGKPEAYVMTVVSDAVTMLHGGTSGAAAFVEVRSIGGLSPKVNKALARQLGAVVAETAHIPINRIYLNFIDVAPGDWGHDGSTFG